MADDIKWHEAQEWEKNWWVKACSSYTNTLHEEIKQKEAYAPRMGIVFDQWDRIDLNGRSVLDVGGGPVSLLLKAINCGRRKVIDPIGLPDWVVQRYATVGIDFEVNTGEDMVEYGWDEVWIYNVLQHVRDPEKLLKNAMAAGKTLRIFEWIDVEISDGHIHKLTTEFLQSVLGVEGVSEKVDLGRGWSLMAFSAVVEKNGNGRSRNKKMRFHIPAIPHTITNDQYSSCAFTIKVKRLCSMLTDLGHEVFHYGCEGSAVNCTEDISVVTDAYRKQFYLGNEDMTKQFTYDTKDEYHQVFQQKCVEEISKRNGGSDFLLAPWGWGHKPITDHFENSMIVVESGIGYSDTFAKYRVFESYMWMHWVYGRNGISNGKFYDAVIPNYFDPNDFKYGEDREDWFLYLGRLVQRKGVELAVDLTKRIGAKLVIAGQGTLKNETEGINLVGDHIEFVGHADVEKRKDLLSRAKAVIMPTYYIEPFGGVAIEAMISGCPVITTDFGAFAETVLHGVTGYRCHTMEQFKWAAKHIGDIAPSDCRNWALQNYSMERVSAMYQEYFLMLDDLRRGGWYEDNDARVELDWLKREYPS